MAVDYTTGAISQTRDEVQALPELPNPMHQHWVDYREWYYDAYINQWVQPDSIVPDFLNPQTLNRYMYTRGNPLRYNDPTGHDVGCAGMDCWDYSQHRSVKRTTHAPTDMPVVLPVPTPTTTSTPILPPQSTPMPLMLPNPECNIPLNSWSLDIDEFGVGVDFFGMAGQVGMLKFPEGTGLWVASEVAEFVTVVQDVEAAWSYGKAVSFSDKSVFTKESLSIGTGLVLDLVSLSPSVGIYANAADIGKEFLFGLDRETVYACPSEPAKDVQSTPIPRRMPVPME